MKAFFLFGLCLFSVSSLAQTSSLYIRGAGHNYHAVRQVTLNNINLATSGRGLSLTIIDAATHTHVSSTIYDTFGSTLASNSLASALNGLQRGFIGVLTSQDAWEASVTPELREAAQRLGLFKLAGGLGSGYMRRPYAAIFRGSGTPTDNTVPNHIAYEVMQSDDADAERAIIATMLIGDAFIGNNLTNALVAGNGSFKGAPVLVNHLGYVGVGTSTPAGRLDVTTSSLDALYLNYYGNDANGARIISRKARGTASAPLAVGTHDNLLILNGRGYYDNGAGAVGFTGSVGSINVNAAENYNHATLNRGSYINFYTTPIGSGTPIEVMRVSPAGNVGIGTTTPDAKLTVKGTIHTQEVKVDLNGSVAPDFVFEEGYTLPKMAETETYIKANKHLPGIPSAQDMAENGIDLKEMNLMLLQKVEELTLHLIEMKKITDHLMEENTIFKEKITILEK